MSPHSKSGQDHSPHLFEAEKLRDILLKAGADDAGFVEVDRPELVSQKNEIVAILPQTSSLASLAFRIHPDSVRTPVRSIAAVEYHYAEKAVQEATRKALLELSALGVRAVAGPMGFPMEMDLWAGRVWTVDHKTVAIAAGLGNMGTSRLVLHPRFGAFVYFSTILIDRPLTRYDQPLEKSECDNCNMCIAVCPTGAISGGGGFNFISCVTHNYRDKLGGFIDWVENVADSGAKKGLRKKVSDSEHLSIWQSLAYHPVNKCDFCMSVCPAGAPQRSVYEQDKAKYKKQIVEPLRNSEENVYVCPGSDAARHVRSHFPHKQAREVSHGIRPNSIASFIMALPHIFQPEASAGISCVYHFSFNGAEQAKMTVVIKDKTIRIADSHEGEADVIVTADSDAWLGFLAKEKNIVWAIITGKIKVKGGLERFKKFGELFAI